MISYLRSHMHKWMTRHELFVEQDIALVIYLVVTSMKESTEHNLKKQIQETSFFFLQSYKYISFYSIISNNMPPLTLCKLL